MNMQKPDWAVPDSICDVTDVWREETGDDESVVTALFIHETEQAFSADPDCRGFDVIAPHLTALWVEDNHAMIYIDAAEAMTRLGEEAVRRIEAAHDEELNTA